MRQRKQKVTLIKIFIAWAVLSLGLILAFVYTHDVVHNDDRNAIALYIIGLGIGIYQYWKDFIPFIEDRQIKMRRTPGVKSRRS